MVLASLAASAGAAASSRATVASFAKQVRDGLSPTLTIDFGSQTTPTPAGTINVPVVRYSSGLGYGWRGAASSAMGPIGRLKASDGAIAGSNSDFEIDLPRGTYDVTVNLAAAANLADKAPDWSYRLIAKGTRRHRMTMSPRQPRSR